MTVFGFTPEQRKAALRFGQFAVDRESVQAPGLVGWWPLGIHGGKAKDWDYSGYGNHATRIGVVPTPAFVPKWGAQMVNDLASNQYSDVENGGASVLNPTTKITVAVFARADGNVTTGYNNKGVFSKFTGAQWLLWTQAADGDLDLQFRVSTNDPSGTRNSLTFTITDNDWHHLAGRYIGGGVFKGRPHLAVDGIDGGAGDSGGGTIKTGSGDVNIGTYQDNGARRFGGALKDARIYNLACPIPVVQQIAEEPWRLVRPLGVRTISFAPAGAAAPSSFQLERKFNRGVMRGVMRGAA